MSKNTSAQSQLFLFVCIIYIFGAVRVAIYPYASIHYTRPPESMCRDKCHNHDTTSEMPSTLHLLDLTYIYIIYIYIYMYIYTEREIQHILTFTHTYQFHAPSGIYSETYPSTFRLPWNAVIFEVSWISVKNKTNEVLL